MANTKEIQKRMKSIQDTMKITSAMYMISSAKLRSAKQKLENTEPYFYALQSAISRLLRHIPDAKSRYFDQREEIPDDKKRRGYIVITADKGLAGAYNHNVIKMAHELFEQGENNKLFVVGELGRQYFTKEGLEVDTEFKYQRKIYRGCGGTFGWTDVPFPVTERSGDDGRCDNRFDQLLDLHYIQSRHLLFQV